MAWPLQSPFHSLKVFASMPKRCARHNGSSLWIAALLWASAASHAETRAQPALDWVPLPLLTPEQKAKVRPSCGGLYIDPLAENPFTAPLDKQPIYIDANGANMADGQSVELLGQVDIRQGNRQLRAQQMRYDKRNEEASLEGGVDIRQPGTYIRGQDAKVNMSRNQAQFNKGQFVLHATQIRGQAEQIEQRPNGEVVLHQGQITSCEPGNESWLLAGESLTLNPATGQGRGRDIQLTLAGVPVFYTPYIAFPIGSQRQSGFLFPSLGLNNKGPDIAQPWYWNIAPEMDATFTPRYKSGHGALLETEFRRLDKSASNTWQLGYLPRDEGGLSPSQEALVAAGAIQASQLHPFKNEARWITAWQHQGGFDTPWFSQVDYTKSSDIDYLRDVSVVSIDAANNTFFNQMLGFGYRLPNWQLDLRLQSYQNLLADLDDTYRQLPRITANGQYHWGSFGLLLNNEYVRFDHTQNHRLDKSPIITGQRSRLDYQLNWSSDWNFGFLQPALGVQALAYTLDEAALTPTANPSPQLNTHYASLDTGLVFERDQGQHTLEPRLFYLYRQQVEHSALYNLTPDHQALNFDTTPLTFSYNQLFRDRRFAGGDRLDDANQMALSLTSRWLDDSSEERLSASLGQLYYFSQRQVFLGATPSTESPKSDLAGQIRTRLNTQWHTQSDILYNASSQQMMRFSSGLNFAQGDQLYNLGYRFVRQAELTDTAIPQTTHQLDMSFVRPITPQWSFSARSFYDLEERKPLDTFAGVSFGDCCYKVKVLARRWLDSKLATLVKTEQDHYDQGLFFEIELKGLGSSGTSIEKLLQQNIPGFSSATF